MEKGQLDRLKNEDGEKNGLHQMTEDLMSQQLVLFLAACFMFMFMFMFMYLADAFIQSDLQMKI